jgi:hypothetical protein
MQEKVEKNVFSFNHDTLTDKLFFSDRQNQFILFLGLTNVKLYQREKLFMAGKDEWDKYSSKQCVTT